MWDRKVCGSFPEAKELKQLIRDALAPRRDLGHSDRKKVEINVMDELDNDDAAALRRHFGVM